MFKHKGKKKKDAANTPHTIPGSLRISNTVIADLAGYTALTCYGVVGMANIETPESLADMLPLHPTRKGIVVYEEDGVLHVTLHVIIDAGTNLSSVSKNLKDSVQFVLKESAQIDACEVHVVIEGIKKAPSVPGVNQ